MWQAATEQEKRPYILSWKEDTRLWKEKEAREVAMARSAEAARMAAGGAAVLSARELYPLNFPDEERAPSPGNGEAKVPHTQQLILQQSQQQAQQQRKREHGEAASCDRGAKRVAKRVAMSHPATHTQPASTYQHPPTHTPRGMEDEEDDSMDEDGDVDEDGAPLEFSRIQAVPTAVVAQAAVPTTAAARATVPTATATGGGGMAVVRLV
jgi:hypothetical protein